MDKRDFVARVRALGIQEPSRDQWETMWDIHTRNTLYSIETVVAMAKGERIADNRRIPEEFKRTALSLEELADFGKSMAEKFKQGGQRARNDNRKRIGDRMG